MLRFTFGKPKKIPAAKAPAASVSDGSERRRYLRLGIMYNLDLRVFIRILPYYRSEELEGQLDNLSAGGLAVRIRKHIPEKNFMYVQVTIPGGLCIACHAEVCHTKKINSHEYQLGLQFLDLPGELKELILFMSKKHIDCGQRIKQYRKTECSAHCAAYGICSRHEKVYVQNSRQ